MALLSVETGDLFGVYTYPEVFQDYPNQWLLVRPAVREGYLIQKMYVIKNSLSKDEILNEAKKRKKAGEDIAVISTIETLEGAQKFVLFDNDALQMGYITPEEYALLFQLYYGLAVAEEYLED